MAFRIPKIPPTSVKSIRFPNPMIEEVEAAIQGQDCTFSAFVVAAGQAARGYVSASYLQLSN